MKKQDQSKEIPSSNANIVRLAQCIVDEALQPDAIFQYLDSKAPGKMQALCVAINKNYCELLEEQFRFDDADVEASLDDVERRLKFHIGEAVDRWVSNG